MAITQHLFGGSYTGLYQHVHLIYPYITFLDNVLRTFKESEIYDKEDEHKSG